MTFNAMRKAASRMPRDESWFGPPGSRSRAVLKTMRNIAHADMLARAHRKIWDDFVRATRRAMKARDRR